MRVCGSWCGGVSRAPAAETVLAEHEKAPLVWHVIGLSQSYVTTRDKYSYRGLLDIPLGCRQFACCFPRWRSVWVPNWSSTAVT